MVGKGSEEIRFLWLGISLMLIWLKALENVHVKDGDDELFFRSFVFLSCDPFISLAE